MSETPNDSRELRGSPEEILNEAYRRCCLDDEIWQSKSWRVAKRMVDRLGTDDVLHDVIGVLLDELSALPEGGSDSPLSKETIL